MAVRTIAVIGAGALGREIAHASVLAGYKTIVEDVVSSRLEQALAWIGESLDTDVAQHRVDGSIRNAALANLSTAGTVEDAVREADLIIETVAEEMEMKIELFTIFDKFAKPGAIFASSAASLSITEMAAVTFCADRCIGMRFVAAGQAAEEKWEGRAKARPYTVHAAPESGAKRLELVRGLETSDETVAICGEAGLRMGREVVVVCEPDASVGGCAELKSAAAQD
jgi:3-hydroxybutyryl-CoA dehydrogenase